ncbi:response regulator transcription factor [Anaeromicropila herbilytica]|uniref:Stage 0 sporulation protein A homolog n=1 Tax=Anaeromicropila herbilytica TaxID=2785025 RepID=A0A7R7IBQ8_9FIRM|nr:response regulator transcription factor [Anaeromicropila herbilytica]BCN29857.1 DNA-binding response regulator [Anaeromicropila herbilytica]
MYKILIVDDEEDIRTLLKDYFEMEGYLIYTAKNGEEAIKRLECKPDLILLDINMPDMDGFEVCKRIRDYVTCPILFLTAKVEERDRVNGLMIGGDDYILKPFSIEELGARVKAHIRRENRSHQKEELRFMEELIINYSKKIVYCKNHELVLTKTEYELIEFLSLNRGQVFTKEAIYERLWGYEKDGDSSIITEHIRRIRMKINKWSQKNFIETVWGVGYRWIG